ncbi:MAG: SDR family oxidoreductase [Acidimicrobiia bacterium]|nr:SDR family oxidoreductase [Acidimicrobiia bacterium]
MRVLVTGATGYIGGRVVPRLLDAGHEVRCLVRDGDKLAQQPWSDLVEVAQADVLDRSSLDAAMTGCDVAFYLIHSMEPGGADFRDRDRSAAANFRDAAEEAAIRRIVYLGGLGPGGEMSPHLESRHEVGRVLASGSVPVTELRAAVIIGSGSVSFEMLRYLTEVLPVMITPSWVRSQCQPIAVGNVLQVLLSALGEAGDESHVIEIGGPDRLTYEEMMRIYAEEAGLPRRLIIPVPVLTPRLSSHWVGLVTPLPASVAKPLVESLKVEVIVSDNRYAERVARPLLGYREAVALALKRSVELEVTTRWSDASPSPAQKLPSDPAWSGGALLTDTREVHSSATPHDLFRSFARLGGGVGYYTMNWAWSLRGMLDSLFGGVGLRRGRRHPTELRAGEALDFWRVASVDPGRSVQLFAEMRMPGEAWLSFEAVPHEKGSKLIQTAAFRPKGLLGRLYWFALYPFHIAIFGRMARRIAEEAQLIGNLTETRFRNIR